MKADEKLTHALNTSYEFPPEKKSLFFTFAVREQQLTTTTSNFL